MAGGVRCSNFDLLVKLTDITIYVYVMQAAVCVSCLGDKCLLHGNLMSTALTQLLIFRFSYLLTHVVITQTKLYKL